MSQSPQVSPKINPTNYPEQTMDFPNAIRAVTDGAKVTKLEWDNPDVIVWLEGRLKIKLADNTIHDLIVTDGDMIGEDWVII